MLIPKLAMLVLGVHYEPSNSNWPKKCEHIVEFLLISYKRPCTVAFGIRQKKWDKKILEANIYT